MVILPPLIVVPPVYVLATVPSQRPRPVLDDGNVSPLPFDMAVLTVTNPVEVVIVSVAAALAEIPPERVRLFPDAFVISSGLFSKIGAEIVCCCPLVLVLVELRVRPAVIGSKRLPTVVGRDGVVAGTAVSRSPMFIIPSVREATAPSIVIVQFAVILKVKLPVDPAPSAMTLLAHRALLLQTSLASPFPTLRQWRGAEPW